LAFREGVAEGGGWGEEFRHARAFRRAKRGGQVRFRFLDLCIRFGKMISKVREGFNLGAKPRDTNSLFLGEIRFSRSALRADAPPAFGQAGLFSAARFFQNFRLLIAENLTYVFENMI